MTAGRVLALAIAIALLLAGGLAPVGTAQTAQSAGAAALAMRDGEIRLINALLTAFGAAMEPRERAILAEIDVRVPMDYDLTRVVAYRLAADRRYLPLFEKAPDMLPGRAQYNALTTQLTQHCT